jgi:hypothetical protein
MTPPEPDPRMDSSQDFADGARYEAQIREVARVNTGHGEMLEFMERIAAAIPWSTDHDLLMKAAYVFAPGIDEQTRAQRASQVCTTGSVRGGLQR